MAGVDEFAARILAAAKEQSSREREARAKRARGTVESRYDWKLIADDLLAVIEDL